MTNTHSAGQWPVVIMEDTTNNDERISQSLRRQQGCQVKEYIHTHAYNKQVGGHDQACRELCQGTLDVCTKNGVHKHNCMCKMVDSMYATVETQP
jgi:hypothetical protein